jgi:hypothetical protein
MRRWWWSFIKASSDLICIEIEKLHMSATDEVIKQTVIARDGGKLMLLFL